jgi:hypothetical protein
MAIIKNEETSSPEALSLVINNGDRKALSAIVESWGFKDDISALRFALALLSVAKRERCTMTSQRV